MNIGRMFLFFGRKKKTKVSHVTNLRGSVYEIQRQCEKLCAHKGIVITSVSICQDFEKYGHEEQFVALISYDTYG